MNTISSGKIKDNCQTWIFQLHGKYFKFQGGFKFSIVNNLPKALFDTEIGLSQMHNFSLTHVYFNQTEVI